MPNNVAQPSGVVSVIHIVYPLKMHEDFSIPTATLAQSLHTKGSNSVQRKSNFLIGMNHLTGGGFETLPFDVNTSFGPAHLQAQHTGSHTNHST